MKLLLTRLRWWLFFVGVVSSDKILPRQVDRYKIFISLLSKKTGDFLMTGYNNILKLISKHIVNNTALSALRPAFVMEVFDDSCR